MTLLLFTFFLIVITYLFKNLINQMTVLNKHRIKGPFQIPFLGNIDTFTKKAAEKIKRKFEKFGPIYGYVFGGIPHLFVSDEELIRKILIKDFHLFKNRGNSFKYGFVIDPRETHSVLTLQDDQWKRVRSLLKTCFSSMQLKKMTKFIHLAVEDMISDIDEKVANNEKIDIKFLFEKVTLQVIADGGFGIDPHQNKEQYLQFINAANKIMKKRSTMIHFMLNRMFGDTYGLFQRLLYKIGLIRESTITKLVIENIERRRKEGFKRNDILQLMLDNEDYIKDDYQDLEITNDDDDNDDHRKKKFLLSGLKKPIKLSEDEIIMNTFIFLLAGFSTTSITLLVVAYFLVRYPDYQEKIRQEVINLHDKEGKLDYNTVSGLPFLDAFVQESMRYYPVGANVINRVASVNYKYKDIVIPKGSLIFISAYYLHHSSEFWDLPEHFDPYRFLPPNKATINNIAFLPFGLGPRNCIAMRLALLEIKMVISLLLKKYRLEPGEYLKTHSFKFETRFGQLASKELPVELVPI